MSNRNENRQDLPRVELSVRGHVRVASGEVLKDVVFDVSRGGLQIRCSREQARLLHPSGTPIRPGQHPQVRLGIQLPFPEGLPEVEAQCTLRYVRGVEAGSFAFGVRFDRFLEQGAQHFRRFIEEAIRPLA